VAAEVLLEVEDGEGVALVEGEELAECGIRLDGLLVHQVVGAGVGHDTLGHRGAADLRVLGLAEEAAELGRDLHGLGEDTGLGLGTLNGLHLALLAAIGLLDHTGRLLLNRLERGRRRAEGRLERGELVVEIGDALLERDTDILLGGGGLGNGNRRRGNNRGLNGDCDRLSGLDLLSLCRLGHNSGGNGRRGKDNGLSGRRLGRLRGLGSLHGRTHFGVIGGSIGGHGTRILSWSLRDEAVKFVVGGHKVAGQT